MHPIASTLSDLLAHVGQDAQLELFDLETIYAPATRTTTVCYACGAEVAYDAPTYGCELHDGAGTCEVTLWRPVVALGLTGVCTEAP